MVQEFHVLKCYSCEAFQVHQVKKSKKWNCKVCGEKQSIIKVFGRGSGVDCRHHVQKLNTRRGEILEDLNQTAWSRWDNTEQEAEGNELGDKEHDNHKVVNLQESRWSKYLLNPGDLASLEEDGEEDGEEENVSMDRSHGPARTNIRKRKKGRGGGGSTYQHREDLDTTQGNWRTAGEKTAARPRTFPISSATAEGSFKTSAPCRPTPVPCRPTPVPCRSTQAPCRPASACTNPSPGRATTQRPLNPAVPNRLGSRSYRPVCSADAAVTKASRWAQFLTSPSPEEEEEEFLSQHVDRDVVSVQDYNKAPATLPGCGSSFFLDHSSSPKHASPSPQCHSPSPQHAGPSRQCHSSPSPQPAGPSPQPGSPSPQPASSSLGLPAEDGFMGSSGVSSSSRLWSTFSLCGFGDVLHSNQGPAPVALHQREEIVCHQPPPTKRPRPSFNVASLFNTDEDFDDAFEL